MAAKFETDYYAELGVDIKAPREDIKSAYRKQITLWHPDKYKPDNNDNFSLEDFNNKFQRIQKAYEVLYNDITRLEYNNTRAVNIIKPISDQVSIREFNKNRNEYSYSCRCGDLFTITTDDIAEGYNSVECPNCSLSIVVCDLENIV